MITLYNFNMGNKRKILFSRDNNSSGKGQTIKSVLWLCLFIQIKCLSYKNQHLLTYIFVMFADDDVFSAGINNFIINKDDKKIKILISVVLRTKVRQAKVEQLNQWYDNKLFLQNTCYRSLTYVDVTFSDSNDDGNC